MSKLIPVFHGYVKDGKLNLNGRGRFDLFIGTLNGKKVQVTVKPYRARRSEQQNAYYWGAVLKVISDHTGYDCEDLHNHFKAHFLKRHVGNLTSFRSTTELNKVEFGEYLDKIIRFASERLDVRVPTPDEVDVQNV
jgi:hypothetical protein